MSKKNQDSKAPVKSKTVAVKDLKPKKDAKGGRKAGEGQKDF